MSNLDASGLKVDTVSDIKARLDSSVKAALGPVNTDADSVVGQITGILASELATLNQSMQDVYNSMYPPSAEGVSLDGAVMYAGMSRNPATPTTAYAVCYGLDGTVIPFGSLARSDIQFKSVEEGNISRLVAIDCDLAVIGLSPNSDYQLSINGIVITYRSGSNPNTPELISGIATKINESEVGNVVRASIKDNFVNVRSKNLIDSFQIRPLALLSISKLGSNVRFECSSTGNIKLPENTLTSIDSPIIGWHSVNNLLAGSRGSDIETDESLRLRYGLSRSGAGFATSDSIRSWILTIPGVTTARVYENRSALEDAYGMPGHSIECLVDGGFDYDIAQMIQRVKGAGIQTHGNRQVIVVDENGDGQAVGFSRARTTYIWVKVEVLALDSEEVLQPDTPALIAQAVVSTGSQIGPSDDVIIQRFIGPIYKATTGIGLLKISMGLTNLADGVPSYSEANIAIARDQIANFDKARVTVIGV